MKPFHLYHIVKIFSLFEEERTPFDLLLQRYMREHHQLGSKDRKWIREISFNLLRWERLLDRGGPPLPWEKRLDIFLTAPLDDWKKNPLLPPSVRCSIPEWIFQKLVHYYGENLAFTLSMTFNERAPFTIRANRNKITRDQLFGLLTPDYKVQKSAITQDGIVFDEPVHLLTSPLYKKGFFEVQDEASQYVASLVKPKPGDAVLDMCAGAGGKSLAFAPDMGGVGKIYLHDIRPQILLEAKERLYRAGILHTSFSLPTKPIDIVLVDAPCSGSGTWRRSPERKRSFSEEELFSLIELQRNILAKAFTFVKPGGRLLYATCSLFSEENQEQLDWLLKHFPLTLEAPPFQSLVTSGGMDGFFAASLKRNCVVSCS